MTIKTKVSVVIASLNGALTIKECIDSIRRQTYKSSLIEIIVVDDCSTDDTAKIAKRAGATVISLKKNIGRGGARNIGWRKATGEIILFTDDDCSADENWVVNLVLGFSPGVIAVGGRVKAKQTSSLVERYLSSQGYGNPISSAFGKSKNPVRRFLSYIESMFKPTSAQSVKSKTKAIFTANAAYKRKTLEVIGGFDEGLGTSEDTDLASRTLLAEPTKHMIFDPAAVVYHTHESSLWRLVTQTFLRSKDTLSHYNKNGSIPPIYPFPIIIVCLLVLSFVINYWAWLIVLVVSPLLFYPWWIVRALREQDGLVITFGYLQFIIEGAEVAGLLAGVLRQRKTVTSNKLDTRTLSTTISLRAILVTSLILSAMAVASTLSENIFGVLVFGLPTYLFLPGFLIQFLIRKEIKKPLNWFLYSFGLSLIYWIFGGLLINSLLPHINITHPLSRYTILIFYIFSIIILSLAIFLTRKSTHYKDVVFSWTFPNIWTIGMVIVSFLLPVLSVLGSTTLNNNGKGYITFVMLFGICGSILLLAILRERVNNKIYPLIIFSVATSLLLMYSMRSWHVIGWDIHDELKVFLRTTQNERWQMSDYKGLAYNACLSITILPTILAKLLHISPEYIYKFVYQLMFAVVPVVIYSTSRRFLSPILSIMAAMMFMSQNWFFELMPALARQEIALIFFALFILIVVDTSLSQRVRSVLMYIFVTGMITSHYSTAYIWLILTVVAFCLVKVSRIFFPQIRATNLKLTFKLLIFASLMLFIWEVPVTNTAGNAGRVAGSLGPQLSSAFSPSIIKDGLQSALIAPPTVNNNKNISLAYNSAIEKRSANISKFYPASTYSEYRVRSVDDREYAQNHIPSFIGSKLHLAASFVRAITNNIMTALGIVLLALMVKRRQNRSNVEFVAISTIGYGLIVAMLLIPYLQQSYNLPRLGLQVFILLVIPAVIGLWTIFQKNRRYGIPFIAVIVVMMLSLQSGLLDQYTGGGLRITMTQPQGTFDTFYVYDKEYLAAHWLGDHRDKSIPVFSDTVAALRLRSYMNYNAATDAFPPTIPKDSYVYLIGSNTLRGHSFYAFNNNTLTFNTPTEFLDQNKDLIYSNGGSKIYR